jgi:hypothetical protein
MPPPPSLRQDRVGGLGSGVWGSGLGVWSFGCRELGSNLVQCLGVGFRGLWGLQGSGFRVEGLGFRV